MSDVQAFANPAAERESDDDRRRRRLAANTQPAPRATRWVFCAQVPVSDDDDGGDDDEQPPVGGSATTKIAAAESKSTPKGTAKGKSKGKSKGDSPEEASLTGDTLLKSLRAEINDDDGIDCALFVAL
jgi:hypothetical protein